MEKLRVTIRGNSMWPSLNDGQEIICTEYTGQPILPKQIIVFEHPFNNKITAVKRVKLVQNSKLFVEGDNPDPTASDDSHNFGFIDFSSVIAIAD
tara:strand:- start:36 stop:320 length:285 start_codon:yes stop_codon:yes gene_type:complete